MPLINSLAEHLDDIREWRHDIHAHPELQYGVMTSTPTHSFNTTFTGQPDWSPTSSRNLDWMRL